MILTGENGVQNGGRVRELVCRSLVGVVPKSLSKPALQAGYVSVAISIGIGKRFGQAPVAVLLVAVAIGDVLF